MARGSDKQAIQVWDEYVKNLRRETPVPIEDEAVKKKRIERLLKHPFEFFKFYFPNYFTSPEASYHRKMVKQITNADNIYYLAQIFREGAKSVYLGLFIPAFEMFNDRLDNMLLISHNKDNAEELLKPLLLNLEHNQRIVNDFGVQKGFKDWTAEKFVTRDGKSFRAIGSGQSPRGAREEEKRPDYILIDDIDTDEEGRNPTRTKKKWDWVEKALFPCMSITGRKRFIIAGNKISKHGVVARAEDKADIVLQINILNNKGLPSWPERMTLEQVNYMLSKISYIAGQQEYFNNPISEGNVFTEIRWGKVPPLKKFKFLVAYCDPSYKNSKKNDYKAIPLVGELDGTFYVVTAFLEQTTIATMINWFYLHAERVNGKATIYNYIEVGGLQDTFYEEIFTPQAKKIGESKGYLSVSKDDRKKSDKFTRIEATLEPLNRQGHLIFNEAEKENPHMQRLEEQFLSLEPSLSAHDDGPDACEGAVWIINNKLRIMAPPKVSAKKRSKYKY